VFSAIGKIHPSKYPLSCLKLEYRPAQVNMASSVQRTTTTHPQTGSRLTELTGTANQRPHPITRSIV
ncbi:MAG: hypothetical protein ACRC8Y_25900, partial [Chroococcales cyanobacterium]